MATGSDFDAIAELVNEFIVNTTTHFGWRLQSAGELREAWELDRRRFPWLVAEVDDRFAGYAKAGTWRSRTAYDWTVETGIYLRAVSRGQGVGKRLYRALIDLLLAQGFHGIVAGLTLPNPHSEALHRTLGFVPIGEVRQAGYKFGGWHDVAFYHLLLASSDEAAAPIVDPAAIWRDIEFG
jgi:phosphinothricin acetyltransferase